MKSLFYFTRGDVERKEKEDVETSRAQGDSLWKKDGTENKKFKELNTDITTFHKALFSGPFLHLQSYLILHSCLLTAI